MSAEELSKDTGLLVQKPEDDFGKQDVAGQDHGSPIELLSEEVQDIISRTPHFLIRWGTTLFLFVFMLIGVMAYCIKYPDTIEVPMKLVAVNAPKVLPSRVEGNLVRLLVKNNTQISKGQPIAYLESIGNHQDVIRVRKWLDYLSKGIEKNGLQTLLTNPKPEGLNLGELQTSWQNFSQLHIQALSTLEGGHQQHKKYLIRNEIENIIKLRATNKKKQELLLQGLTLAENEYRMNETLYKEKVISLNDFNKEKSKFIDKKQHYEEAYSAEFGNNSLLNNKLIELNQIEREINDQQAIFLTAIVTFQSQVDAWLKKYIVQAPIDGVLNYTSFFQENQLIKQSQELFYIQPRNSTFYGEAFAPQGNLGKLKVGQKVIIKFDSYPYTEFGTVNGTVGFISEIPDKDNKFILKISLPEGLMTSYNKEIYYRSNLRASALIITDDKRLIEKLVFQMNKIFQYN